SSVIWFRNAFFLNNINSVLLNLFSGATVPIWFFPRGLKALSDFLPFRYIVFEPVSILLGTKDSSEIIFVLWMQILWIAILYSAVTFIWNRGRHKIMIQGG
ncbi:MAG: ABC-2 family transporter protein, partial [Lachnospiraceae bacterium]|nr:ABC-2 family transporter protein [Lachnospiraceae bacterium]